MNPPTLYLTNVCDDVSDDDVKMAFPVEIRNTIYDVVFSTRSKNRSVSHRFAYGRYAYVNFYSIMDAEEALHEGTLYIGHTRHVLKWSFTGHEGFKSIFVSNLRNCRESVVSKLLELFEPVRIDVEHDLPVDKDKDLLCCVAQLSYESFEAAQHAMRRIDGFEFDGKILTATYYRVKQYGGKPVSYPPFLARYVPALADLERLWKAGWEQNQKTEKDENKCPICMDRSYNVVLQCGHVLCRPCVECIQCDKNRCPFCLVQITQCITMRI